MRKVFYILLFLCICFGSFLFESCSSSKWTQQNLSNAFKLNPGMSKEEVLEIMGSPIRSEFFDKVDEWHYCNGGWPTKEFLAIFFFENKLIATKTYVYQMNGYDDITSWEYYIKKGNYSEPDVVIEIRSI